MAEESVRRLKANKRVADAECPSCSRRLMFGEDAVVCMPCKRAYHASCWDDAGGCANDDCENAALVQIEEPAEKKPEIADRSKCPHCGRRMRSTAKICLHCKRARTPDGVYRGPRQPAPGASAALTFGILSLFICGLIFGILAIAKAGEAQKVLARDPTYTGQGMATAGKITGIIGLVAWSLYFLALVGGGI